MENASKDHDIILTGGWIMPLDTVYVGIVRSLEKYVYMGPK